MLKVEIVNIVIYFISNFAPDEIISYGICIFSHSIVFKRIMTYLGIG